MNAVLNYCLLRYQPHISRHEVVNIGVVLFSPEGPKLELASNLSKLRALDPNASLIHVHEQAASMAQTMGMLWQSGSSASEIVAFLSRALSGMFCMPLGTLDATGMTEAEVIDELMRDLVLPPARKRSPATANSRLSTELRTVFQQARMLGRDQSDIDRHLIVPHFPIDADLGLYAEFALRNGRFHVTETVDFRVKDAASKKREAESKTLVLLKAMEAIGKDDLLRHVVVSGANTDAARTSIALLTRHADDVFVRESAEDWRRYLDLMHQAVSHGQSSVHH